MSSEFVNRLHGVAADKGGRMQSTTITSNKRANKSREGLDVGNAPNVNDVDGLAFRVEDGDLVARKVVPVKT